MEILAAQGFLIIQHPLLSNLVYPAGLNPFCSLTAMSFDLLQGQSKLLCILDWLANQMISVFTSIPLYSTFSASDQT